MASVLAEHAELFYSNSEDLFFAALDIPRRWLFPIASIGSFLPGPSAILHEVERLIENHEKKLTNFILDRPAVSHLAEDLTVGVSTPSQKLDPR